MKVSYILVASTVMLSGCKSVSRDQTGSEVLATTADHYACVGESTIAIDRIPSLKKLQATGEDKDGDYSKSDKKTEKKFCGINLQTAMLCPKTWSTSPGTIVWEGGSGCSGKSNPGGKKLAKFKTTMNQSGTSGTFSPSSLMYYHFSRILNTSAYIPVSIFAKMPRKSHYDRVSKNTKGRGRMNIAGWTAMKKATGQGSYSPSRQMFYQGSSDIYGILIRGKGERYGPVFNGIRSKWGAQSSVDFQDTPGYMTIKSRNSDLQSAIAEGVAGARTIARGKQSRYKTAAQLVKDIDGTLSLQGDAAIRTKVQVAYWAKEMTEIAILDYIFSQQDRIGNIDYRWYWYYAYKDSNGKVSTGNIAVGDKKHQAVAADKQFKDLSRSRFYRKAASVKPAITRFIEEKLAAKQRTLVNGSLIAIQRTQVNDNDAGGLVRYANFAKKAKMLQNIRHISRGTYERLILLHNNLQGNGHVKAWLNKTKGLVLGPREIKQVVRNTELAAGILMAKCKSGSLDFDLEPKDLMISLFGGENRTERGKPDCQLGGQQILMVKADASQPNQVFALAGSNSPNSTASCVSGVDTREISFSVRSAEELATKESIDFDLSVEAGQLAETCKAIEVSWNLRNSSDGANDSKISNAVSGSTSIDCANIQDSSAGCGENQETNQPENSSGFDHEINLGEDGDNAHNAYTGELTGRIIGSAVKSGNGQFKYVDQNVPACVVDMNLRNNGKVEVKVSAACKDPDTGLLGRNSPSFEGTYSIK